MHHNIACGTPEFPKFSHLWALNYGLQGSAKNRLLSRQTDGRERHLEHNSDTNGQHSEKQHYALAAPEDGSWMRPVPLTPYGAFLRVIKVTECDTPPSLPMRFGRQRFRTRRCTTGAAASANGWPAKPNRPSRRQPDQYQPAPPKNCLPVVMSESTRVYADDEEGIKEGSKWTPLAGALYP